MLFPSLEDLLDAERTANLELARKNLALERANHELRAERMAFVAAAVARQWVAEQSAKLSTARERHARRLFPWLLLCLAVALLVLAHAVWISNH